MTKEVEVRDQSRVDRIIWRHIDVKTVREIAEMTGEKPEYILRRKNELVTEIDSLTIKQKRTRLLTELDGMARDARDRASKASDEFYAGMINSSTSPIKIMLAELARMEKTDDTAVEALNQKRTRELLRLIDTVVTASVREISKTYELEEADLMSVFRDRLVQEAQRMDETD